MHLEHNLANKSLILCFQFTYMNMWFKTNTLYMYHYDYHLSHFLLPEKNRIVGDGLIHVFLEDSSVLSSAKTNPNTVRALSDQTV